jgi:Mitochondrial carrier protein
MVVERRLERRNTMPQELEDPEDMTIGEAEAEMFDDARRHSLESSAITGSLDQAQQQQQQQQQQIQEEEETSITRRLQSLTTREAVSQNVPKEIRNILAGGIAGMIAKSVVAPVERIKILYQVTATEFQLRKLPEVARNIVKNEGASAMWKGNTATLLRVFPYSGIQFMVFDRLKTHFLSQKHHFLSSSSSSSSINEHDGNKRKWGLSPLESLIAGMTAGVISVVFTYPLDLTRAQLAVLKRHKHDSGTLSFYEVLTNNYRQRGVAGLFRGITPTLCGIIPYSGLAFTMNEQGKRKVRRCLHVIDQIRFVLTEIAWYCVPRHAKCSSHSFTRLLHFASSIDSNTDKP